MALTLKGILAQLLVVALGHGIAAQELAPTPLEFQSWHACGGIRSSADANPVHMFGEVHSAADGTLMLYLRHDFQSPDFAGQAFRREIAGAIETLNISPAIAKSRLTRPNATLVLTGKLKIPLGYAPGAIDPKVGLLRTDGAALHMVFGPSVDHVLASTYVRGRDE